MYFHVFRGIQKQSAEMQKHIQILVGCFFNAHWKSASEGEELILNETLYMNTHVKKKKRKKSVFILCERSACSKKKTSRNSF